MKNLTIFDCTAAYDFGKKTDGSITNENKSSIVLTVDERGILDQVISHAKNCLFSRFADNVCQAGDENRPYFHINCKEAELAQHREMIRRHQLTQADLPEFMEDMISEETFVRSEPLTPDVCKKIFVFRDMIRFEENGEEELVELAFTLNMIDEGIYDMDVLSFGYPVDQTDALKKIKQSSSGNTEDNRNSTDLTKDERNILNQVINHANHSLFSRFSDFVYGAGNERPHYKFNCKGKALTQHREMLKRHQLMQADLPEFMEDMISEETFVRAEPLCINKRRGIWKTVFVFRDKVRFEATGERETIELRFTLDKIIKGVYDMEILAFGCPVPEEKVLKKEKKPSKKKNVSFWCAA